MSVQKKMATHNFMKSSNAKSNYVFKTYLLRLPIFYDLSLGPSTRFFENAGHFFRGTKSTYNNEHR